jgi:predicted SprT family Zn-dependent metalloprotease
MPFREVELDFLEGASLVTISVVADRYPLFPPPTLRVSLRGDTRAMATYCAASNRITVCAPHQTDPGTLAECLLHEMAHWLAWHRTGKTAHKSAGFIAACEEFGIPARAFIPRKE